jgi:basic membrane lipoprotein Med (substrate-binding protein (PBP1-ABC) superfamily)
MSRSFSRRGVLAAGAGLLGAGLVPTARAAQAPRLAAVLTGSVTEAWAGSVHRAALAAASAGAVRYDWAGNVPHADGASAIRRAAEAGADLVVADVFGAEQTARAVAAEFPGTAFLFGSSFGPDAEAANVAVFDSRIDEACHLAGIVAGAVTVTGHIGLVADYPLRGVNQLMHAFATGAREVRPGLVFEAGFTASVTRRPCMG